MKFSKITAVYYSPTGNAKKVVTYIANLFSNILDIPLSFLSYTLPQDRVNINIFENDELVIFATPVYAGRFPNKLLTYLQSSFIGKGTAVIPIVVFGNRNFDNALSELCGELNLHNFVPFAAASIASEHVFSSLIATGRPDEKDFKEIETFVHKVAKYIKESTSFTQVKVSGAWPNSPYYKPLGINGEATNFLKAKPKTYEDKCDNCKACALSCPMAAIDKENTSLVPGTCIKCQACVKVCHTNAKYFDDPDFLSHVKMLEANFTKRVEPSFFFPE